MVYEAEAIYVVHSKQYTFQSRLNSLMSKSLKQFDGSTVLKAEDPEEIVIISSSSEGQLLALRFCKMSLQQDARSYCIRKRRYFGAKSSN